MSGKGCCAVCKVVGLLVTIGAINWGLYGLAQIDLVQRLLGTGTTPARVVYVLIGIAGLLKLVSMFKCCPCQKDGGSCSTAPKK